MNVLLWDYYNNTNTYTKTDKQDDDDDDDGGELLECVLFVSSRPFRAGNIL
jgi:hypothetical protein